MLRDRRELERVPLDEAVDRWLGELDFRGLLEVTQAEEIAVEDSLGRITAGSVIARLSSPGYYASAIEGVAVSSRDTYGATTDTPVKLDIGKNAFFVGIGDQMPEGFDAVIPLYAVSLVSVDVLETGCTIAPWYNVRPVGEDIAAREILLHAGHKIRSLDIGVLLQGGITRVKVRRKPVITIIPIGNNLIPPGRIPEPGKSIETDSYILAGLITELGGRAVLPGIVPEKPDEAAAALEKIDETCDLVIIVGGSSWGTLMPASVLAEKGELIIYGVAMKPGQSTALGFINGKPAICLPFFPVSAFMGFEFFVKPVIVNKLGAREIERSRIEAELARPVSSPGGVEEFLRMEVTKVGDKTVALPLSRSSALQKSLARADGYLRLPEEHVEIPAGQSVTVYSLRQEPSAGQKLFIMGTHDIILDILQNEYEQRFPGCQMTSSAVGGLAGLEALRAGLCHVSGIHLFDPETGEYNMPFLPKLIGDFPVTVVNLFYRQLGFIVGKGNPKGINELKDLMRDDVTFVNRNQGSGTRQIFDFLTRKQNMDISKIKGYDNHINTHMSVALAVAGGGADAGIGIYIAAKALSLDFIPLTLERLDLVIPNQFINNYIINNLMKLVNSSDFKHTLSKMQGYDFSDTGKVFKQRA
ncbi:MAG: molybdopterin biosynthesis protein [Chloroflexi bacterium]|nr:molybdopterin biosynthesis protein [Chloroflexota bacterium]